MADVRGNPWSTDVGPDGPDTMGREIAEGPASVAATLAGMEGVTNACAEALRGARRVVIVGMGASLAMANIAAPLWRVGRRAHGDDRPVMVRESSIVVFGSDGERIADGDVVIAVSYRGTSPETLAAAELARRAGRPVIAVTRNGEPPLVGAATHVVEVDSGTEEKGAATKSALATLAALLALADEVPTDAATRASLRTRLEATIGSWESIVDVGRQLADAERTWMVGLGAGEGLAMAGSLLWHEKVIRPALSLSASSFRHGPVEAIRPRDAVVAIDVGPSTSSQASYLALLAEELERLGCVGAWIGPEPPWASRGIALVGRGAPATLEAVLRMQQLARATALAAGTYAEDFRVLLEVVRASPPLV